MSTGLVKGLSVETYEKMVRKGVLPETSRFELIEGRLVEKMTKREHHSGSLERCWRLIHAMLPAGWHVRIEEPVRIPSRKSEPEPDVSVARGSHEDYDERHPGPGDIALVVEIARSSVAKDRKLARVYAAAGIPAYWIIDVHRRRLEVFEGPAGEQYPPARILSESDTVDLVIGERAVGQIVVAELLPKKRGTD